MRLCRLSLCERAVFSRRAWKKWGQAPRVGVILPVVRIGWRSQSPFFHKLGAKGAISRRPPDFSMFHVKRDSCDCGIRPRDAFHVKLAGLEDGRPTLHAV